ncbi:MAG: hypothetical protein BJ554DRAFT_4648 [Olpidium bornovanus]|uniref:Secreted protein n=1 Tax=Olpidium bornovanus TaxID=278681 RepID=A0A8H7ZMH5_9FUNG|nr:MAG: hypothetical protein BJ554DRAFT_4648 [Olpidium bornovanus]
MPFCFVLPFFLSSSFAHAPVRRLATGHLAHLQVLRIRSRPRAPADGDAERHHHPGAEAGEGAEMTGSSDRGRQNK